MKTFWDRFAFAYDTFQGMNKKVYQEMLLTTASLIPPQADVLECAAGTGAISLAVAPRAKRVLCTDLSLSMLDQARKKAKRKKLNNITFAERDLFHLKEQKESFDVVIAANVIHLLDHPNDAIMELWRVTKHNGQLIIPTFLTGNSKSGLTMLLNVYKLLGFRPKYTFSEANYRHMLEHCGLPKPDISIIEGRIPVGFAVFNKN